MNDSNQIPATSANVEPATHNKLTRRGFLGAGSVAVAGMLPTLRAAAQEQTDRSRSDPGPKNATLDAQNPDSVTPPGTDSGAVPTFKYPFSFANKRLYEGGWSREVTIRELPISKSLAGVNMRLTAGGVRELHWHTAGEWALVLYGSARLTAFDAEGKSFVGDVKKNDLWYFPAGVPHSIQGLDPDGTEFLLVFDDGSFSEFGTVLLSDTIRHTPPEVLAKNFGVAEQALDPIPKKELFIFQTKVPGSLEDDRKAAAGKLGTSAQDFSFRTMDMPVTRRTKGGEIRVVDSSKFKVATTVAMAMVTVHPGGLRELHWHPNADEWQYFIAGKGRMTTLATGGHARTMDFQEGDVGYVPITLPHYIENTGDTDLVFLEMFKSSFYQDFSLSEWLSHTPPELVMAHLHIDRATYDKIPKEEFVVIPG